MATHDSDSAVQREAEAVMIRLLGTALGLPLAKGRAPLPGGGSIEIDGYGEGYGRTVLAEAYARIGPLRGSQVKKVSADVLRLSVVQAHLARGVPSRVSSCHLVFLDHEAAAYLDGTSWTARMARYFGMHAHIVGVSPDLRARILAAQTRQRKGMQDSSILAL